MTFEKSIGDRLQVIVTDNGRLDHSYGRGSQVVIRAGWNAGCPMVVNTMSIDDMRDLRYLLDRALEYAGAARRAA